MINKEFIIKKYSLDRNQELMIVNFISELRRYNEHTNIVGKSTLKNPWNRHVLDCAQIERFLKNKKSSIIDMGAGAGLPGLVLFIMGYKNISLVDSNNKKIKFLFSLSKKLKINPKIILSRVESIKNSKYDYVISRALANLDKLLTYSQNFLKKNTVLIFLKGKTVNYEIVKAEKNWIFSYELFDSISDSRGKIIIIKGLKRR